MELSNLQQFLIELNHSGKSEYNGALKNIALRLRFVSSAKVDALTAMLGSGASRNKVLNDLIEIALDEVYSKLSPEQKAHLDELESLTLADSLFVVDDSGSDK